MLKNIISIGLIMVPALYFGYKGEEVVMGLSVVTSSIAVTFLNLDKFQAFSGAGFKAEMRKEVDKAVEEAYATIDNLKEVAKPLFITTMANLAFGNRFMDMSVKEKHEIKLEIDRLISELDIADESINNNSSLFHKLQSRDFYKKFCKEVEKMDNEHINDLIEKLEFNEELSDMPKERDIIRVIEEIGIELGENAKKRLDDYLYYVSNNTPPSNYQEENS